MLEISVMTLEKLNELIAGGEGERLEYKETNGRIRLEEGLPRPLPRPLPRQLPRLPRQLPGLPISLLN